MPISQTHLVAVENKSNWLKKNINLLVLLNNDKTELFHITKKFRVEHLTYLHMLVLLPLS